MASPGTGPSTTIPAGNNPQTISITVNGNPASGVLPAGVALPAGAAVAVLPSGTTFLGGLTLGPTSGRHRFTPAQTGGSGSISINGLPTGVSVSSDGQISSNLILPSGSYKMTIQGPFTIHAGASVLTVNQFKFSFASNGVALSLPISITMQVPGDGGTWTKVDSATATFNPAFNGGSIDLAIFYGAVEILGSRTIANEAATFRLQNQTYLGTSIPNTGVDTIEFDSGN